MPRKYYEEHIKFMRDNFPGTTLSEFVQIFNEQFGTKLPQSTIAGALYRNGIKNGRDAQVRKGERNSPATEFKKGQIPWNKGKKGISYPGMVATQFKKGQASRTKRPIGSERICSDGYTWVKVADPKTWREKHRVIWETAHGPIPKGHAVIFLDSSRQNIDIDNLALVTRGQLAVLNKKRLISTDAKLTKAGIAVAQLSQKVYEKKSKSKGARK